MSQNSVKPENSQMASVGVIFSSIYHKAAKAMAKPISQSSSELQPAVCLSRGEGAI